MAKHLDGYLSRLVQAEWPGGLVFDFRNDDDLRGTDSQWMLQRPGMEDLGMGDTFHAAKQAVHALLAAERQRRSGSPESPAKKE